MLGLHIWATLYRMLASKRDAMSALHQHNAQLEELDCNTPNTPKLQIQTDVLNKKAAPSFAKAIPQARQSPARKKTISTSRLHHAHAAKRRHVGPLITQDDSKPANFTDLGSFGLLHPSVLLRPPFTHF